MVRYCNIGRVHLCAISPFADMKRQQFSRNHDRANLKKLPSLAAAFLANLAVVKNGLPGHPLEPGG